MSLTVKQYHPILTIRIIKNEDKNLAGQAQSSFELTTSMGTRRPEDDILQVSTHKDLAEVAGTFQLRLTGRRDEHGLTYANLIEPMDFVEIRMSHEALRPSVSPVIMRGFVDEVQLVRAASADGSPENFILVNGRDYGKFLLRGLYFLLAGGDNTAAGGASIIPGDAGPPGLEALAAMEFGLSDGGIVLDPKVWVKTVLDHFFDPTYGVAAIPDGAPAIDYQSLIDGCLSANYRVMSPQTGPFTGSIWNYISSFASTPYFEMFVTDDYDSTGNGKPYFIWRRSPYHEYVTGQSATTLANSAQPGVDADVSTVILPAPNPLSLITDIIAIKVGRSDQDAYNFFLCTPAKNAGGDDINTWSFYAKLISQKGAAVWDEGLTKRFGFQPLDPTLTLISRASGITTAPELNTETENDTFITNNLPKYQQLSIWLEKAYAGNYLFEQGSITCRGNTDLRVGRHVTIKETGQEFYIENVDHSFSVDPINFQTTITVTRGRWPQGKVPYIQVDTTTGELHPPQVLGVDAISGPPTSGGSTPPTPPAGPPTNPGGNCHAVLPFSGGEYPCTQAYGETQWEHPHAGIDIGVPSGTQLVSPVDGTVIFVYDHNVPNYNPDLNEVAPPGDGCGNYIIVQGPNMDQWKLCHLQSGSLAPVGTQLSAGVTPIAISDNSGWSSGPHLHLEYHPGGGATADPTQCFPQYAGLCPR